MMIIYSNYLLISCDMLVFKNASHSTCSKASLSNVEQSFDHCIEDKLVVAVSEAQAALHGIVSKLIKQKRRDIGFQMRTHEINLYIGATVWLVNLCKIDR